MNNKTEHVTVIRKAISYTFCIMSKQEFKEWQEKCQGPEHHANGDDEMLSVCCDPVQNFKNFNSLHFAGDEIPPQYAVLSGTRLSDDHVVLNKLFTHRDTAMCYDVEFLEPIELGDL